MRMKLPRMDSNHDKRAKISCATVTLRGITYQSRYAAKVDSRNLRKTAWLVNVIWRGQSFAALGRNSVGDWRPACDNPFHDGSQSLSDSRPERRAAPRARQSAALPAPRAHLLGDLPRLLDLAQHAAQLKLNKDLHLAVHSLRGSASHLGALAVVEAAWAVEKLAKDEAWPELPDGVGDA